MYSVQLSSRAARELKKLRREVARRILDSLELLAVNPYAEVLNFKKLKINSSLYRIGIGDYRVIYEIKADLLIVIVVRVGHRKDVYDYLK